MKVEVVKYNPEWSEIYNSEKVKLNESLGGLIKSIHHIGSTSIPGLAAKPIIDIIIEVCSLDTLDNSIPVMESLGYEVKGEFGIPGRRYYRKGGSNRTHQIHAFKVGDANIKRHIAFRDYLKSHPDVMLEYASLKMALAKRFDNDVDGYCDGKDDFVKHHESKAIEWLNNTNNQARSS